VTTRPDPEALAPVTDRYLVVRFAGDRAAFDAAVNSVSEEPVQVRAVGETLVFRYGDAVRAQSAIKERFGEFAYRATDAQRFETDPAWLATNIVTDTIPLLGEVTCHHDFVALLRAVMERLEAVGAEDAIDPDAFRGCWNSRFIAGRRDLSRHSFGVAADINFFNPLDGPASPVDLRLLAAMEAVGITSGHEWMIPDPGHFEWFTDP
jgi:hypothetical protein